MSRSILLSIMFIAGTLGIIAFSAAQFTDFETTTSNPIQAGTLDLHLTDSPNGAIDCVFDATGLEGAPVVDGTLLADTQAVCSFSVTHSGTLEDADLYAMVTVASIPCAVAGTPTPPGVAGPYCNDGAELTDAEFNLVARTGIVPVDNSSTSFQGYLGGQNTNPHGGNDLKTCVRWLASMPKATAQNGAFTIELQQDRTSNNMQGDAITIKIDFELVEDGTVASTVDCVADTPANVTP